MDAVFSIYPEGGTAGAGQGDKDDEMSDRAEGMVEIRAHKCVLTARTDYFKALFRKGAAGGAAGDDADGGTTRVAFREADECTINVEPTFSPLHIRYMLEFV